LGAQKFALGSSQFRSGYASDECAAWHRAGLPQPVRRSRKPRSIALDDALPAGSLQVDAELRGLIAGGERPDRGAVKHALFAEIGPLDQWRARAEHVRELALQRLVGSLGIGLGLLRGDLDDKTTAAAGGGGRCGIDR